MQIELSFDREFKELYRDYTSIPKGLKLLKIEGIDPDSLDVAAMSREYFTKEHVADVSIDTNANANETKNPSSYTAELTKGILKLEGYCLLWRYANKRFGLERAKQLIESIWDGDLYFHDAAGAMVQIPYCYAYSTTNLMIDGRPYGQLRSVPPKSAHSFMGQVIETTMDMSNENAGAIAVADMIVNYAWYAKSEGLTAKRIKDDLQWFVHVVNNQFRMGSQSPFTNVPIFCRSNLKNVFEHYRYPDGSEVDIEYVMYIQKLFGEWFSKGDPMNGSLPYRFPVVTLNIRLDDNGEVEDEDFLKWTAKVNRNSGCFNIYISQGNKVASCCRLVNDIDALVDMGGGDTFGNGGISIGSHRVVTVNLAKIGAKAKSTEQFYQLLDLRLQIARDLLIVHRELIRKRIGQGFLKFFTLGWADLDRHLFSTVGLNGVYECLANMGEDLTSERGQAVAKEVFTHISTQVRQFARETGKPFNVEQIPAESVAVKFAQKDRLHGLNDKWECYGNQFVPLTVPIDLHERIRLDGMYSKMLTGGGITHLNVSDRLQNDAQMERLIRFAIKSGCEHFAVNFGFGTCENGHTEVVGNSTICPKCGGFVGEHYTRVIGYFTKVSSWNKTRREVEFPERKFLPIAS